MIELHFARLQTALFLTSLDATRKLDLAMNIRDASEGLLDADPLILPIPPDAPPELPRLQLKSGDGLWSYQVTGKRLDFVFELPLDELGTKEFTDIVPMQASIGSAIWNAIQTTHNASGNRIGVVSLFVGLVDDPVHFLQTRFMRPSDAPEPHELQLHTLHKMVLGDVPINRWVRCFAGTLMVGGSSQDMLRLEIDVNTLSEQPTDLSRPRIVDFITKVRDLDLDVIASLVRE